MEIRLTHAQQNIVAENMGLVGKVIRDNVHGIGQSGLYCYDDLFQIGCVGLCKAVAAEPEGRFSTYAYRAVWNEICRELNRLYDISQNERNVEQIAGCQEEPRSQENGYELVEVRHLMDDLQRKPGGIAGRERKCLELSAQGYSSREIGRILGADAGKIRVWMSRTRKNLRARPEIRGMLECG